MQDSIYHKRPGAFKQFIIRIDDASLTVAEALSNYREIRTLTRELKYLTIEHLRNDPNLILKVWQSLREGMAPEAKFKLPFKKKEDHEKQLIKGISDLYTID